VVAWTDASLPWLGLAWLVAACGNDGGGSTIDARVFGEQCVPGGTFALDGRAAVLGTLNVHVNASGLVEVDTTAELLIALDLDQTGTAVAVRAEACAIEIPEIPIAGQDRPIRFEVPEAATSRRWPGSPARHPDLRQRDLRRP
jgi:hypothetical protein